MHKVLHLIAKLNADKGQAPEWVVLFAAGLGTLHGGIQYLVDKTAYELVASMARSRGNEIHFDFEHASVQDRSKIATGAPAAGWIKELAWEDGVGIKARVEWTDKAAAHIAAREYRYFSPVFGVRKADKRLFYLDSVALTNRPRTNNLTPILAALEERLGYSKEEKMNKEQLIAALGLDENATDADILVAIAALGVEFPEAETQDVIPETITAALDLDKGESETVVVASIHAMKQASDNSISIADFKKLEDRLAKRDADDLVKAAMAAGKIPPANKDWATDYATKDPEGFKVFVAKAPVVVPVDDLPGKTETVDPGKLTSEDLQVAAQMGVAEGDLKTYGLEVNDG